MKLLLRIRYCTYKFSSRQLLVSSPLLFFTAFSSKQPCTITANNTFVNWILPFATLLTKLLVLVFAKILTFDFAMVCHSFLGKVSFPFYGLDICRMLLLQGKLMKTKLKLFLIHTCLTGLRKKLFMKWNTLNKFCLKTHRQ